MDPRLPYLAVPSLIVLGLLLAHSLRALRPLRAVLFWCAVAAYGVLRSLAIRWVVALGPATTFPYAMRRPLFPILGVGLQEIAGWAIAVYLSWWIGARLSRQIFVQVAWAFLTLASLSWAVESAAIAAGWWSWTLPVTMPVTAPVPFIAIVDWAFVALDFLLPFVLITGTRGGLRWVSLGLFPLHFASHIVAGHALGPVPLHHLVHWAEIAGLVWLALRSTAEDVAFMTPSRLPALALAIVLGDALFIDAWLAGKPELSRSIAPAVVLGLFALRRNPVESRPRERRVAAAAIVALTLLAFVVHASAARREQALKRGLDAAIATRDRGDLDQAWEQLHQLAIDFPGSHVPPALLGEIDYRKERLDRAADEFRRAVAIKRDFVRGWRYLAVIALRRGRKDEAAIEAERGLVAEADDPELRYLAGRALPPRDGRSAAALAGLAFEVGDAAGAAAILEDALVRWPGERSLYPMRVRLALAASDREGALRWLDAWRRRFPEDAEALQLARGLGASERASTRGPLGGG